MKGTALVIALAAVNFCAVRPGSAQSTSASAPQAAPDTLPSASQRTPSAADVQVALRQGFGALNEHDYTRSLAPANEVIAVNGETPLAYDLPGAGSFGLHDYSGAITSFRRAPQAQPTEPHNLSGLVSAYTLVGMDKERDREHRTLQQMPRGGLPAVQTALGYPATAPTLVQKQAIQAVDQYKDHFHRTGDLSSLVPELRKAYDQLDGIYPAFVAKGDFAGVALTALTMADIVRMVTLFAPAPKMLQEDPAIALYNNARDFAKRANHVGYQFRAVLGLARVDLNHADLGAAADDAAEALRLAKESGDKTYLFQALDTLGELEVKRRNYAAASEYLNQALAMSDEVRDRAELYQGYLDRGEVYFQIELQCDYEMHFEVCSNAAQLATADYKQALAMARDLHFDYYAKVPQQFLQQQDLLVSMQAEGHKLHDQFRDVSSFHITKASQVYYNKQFAPLPDPALAAQVHRIKQRPEYAMTAPMEVVASNVAGITVEDENAQTLEMEGKNDEALAAYLKAVGLLERDRTRLHDEESRNSFLSDKINIYYAAILELLDHHRLAEAFDLMERSRSRVMSDLLASRLPALGTARERGLLAESMKLNDSIATAQKKLFRFQAEPGEHSDEIPPLQSQIKAMESQDQELQTRIAKEAPRLNRLLVSQPVSLESAQRSARQGNYDLICYLALSSGLIIWHITGDDVQVLDVMYSRSLVNQRVEELRQSLTRSDSEFDEQAARELFLVLIDPLQKSIKTRHLVILPHEQLNVLPFQVLQDPADGTYLGERFQISYAPSATVLAALDRQPDIAKGKLLAVADPRMHSAVEEVEAVARLYPGRSMVVDGELAQKEDVKAWARNFNLIHFSVHGTFDGSDPLGSAILLRPTAQDDGRFTAAEMFGLPLQKNSLVVMSACQTGQVKVTESSEILGLVRALVYAGASDLVLSSWEVDAESTKLWMETFYRAAQNKPPAEAARLALVAVKARPEYRHPFFWAPFLMTGR
jgi:CHAT domain-containing protein/tetratricopeptide (TPR) repeat protein